MAPRIDADLELRSLPSPWVVSAVSDREENGILHGGEGRTVFPGLLPLFQ